MKLSVIGLGQCGCNIADLFYDVSRYSQSFFNRHISIVTDTFAINTDEADLSSFKHIPKDKGHRILIGTMDTFGHGVGKINTDAANIIKSANSVIVDTVLRSTKFHESDAILVIASSGGGTGSGTVGSTIKALKERTEKPVYALLVLPFEFEKKGEMSYAVINSATCIKTVNQYADAVILFDNERHRKIKSNLADNLNDINKEIVVSFYDLCCAGEERKQKYIGSKVVDAGDIKQSLIGISAIGRGEIELPKFCWKKGNYHQGIKETNQVFSTLRQAETNLGLGIDLGNARRILILVTGPKDYLSVGVLEEMFAYFAAKAPKALIRIGDYPRRDREITLTLIASELVKVNQLDRLFLQAEGALLNKEEIGREIVSTLELSSKYSSSIPTLD